MDLIVHFAHNNRTSLVHIQIRIQDTYYQHVIIHIASTVQPQPSRVPANPPAF